MKKQLNEQNVNELNRLMIAKTVKGLPKRNAIDNSRPCCKWLTGEKSYQFKANGHA